MQSSISNNMIYYAYANFASAPQISQAYGVTPLNQETKTGDSTEYGRRLIPPIMDDLAASKPGTTVFSLAVLLDGLLKVNPISACQFTRAVDKTALAVSRL